MGQDVCAHRCKLCTKASALITLIACDFGSVAMDGVTGSSHAKCSQSIMCSGLRL
jgi:hypothetical protein